MKRIIRKLASYLKCENDRDLFWGYRENYHRTSSKIQKLYYSLKYKRLINKYNASIPLETKMPGRIALPHGLNGILISQGTQIGYNCTIFHQVTIGSNMLDDTKKKGAPIIGNNVYVGAGAKIIGGIKVGDNVRIGANCVVVEDVPDNCTVVMHKPRLIVHKTEKNNDFTVYSKT